MRHNGWKQEYKWYFWETISEVIEAIRSKEKSPDCFFVQNYIFRHNTTNLDKKLFKKTTKVLVYKTILKNKPTAVSNSYHITSQDQENMVVLERSEKESRLKEELVTEYCIWLWYICTKIFEVAWREKQSAAQRVTSH